MCVKYDANANIVPCQIQVPGVFLFMFLPDNANARTSSVGGGVADRSFREQRQKGKIQFAILESNE